MVTHSLQLSTLRLSPNFSFSCQSMFGPIPGGVHCHPQHALHTSSSSIDHKPLSVVTFDLVSVDFQSITQSGNPFHASYVLQGIEPWNKG